MGHYLTTWACLWPSSSAHENLSGTMEGQRIMTMPCRKTRTPTRVISKHVGSGGPSLPFRSRTSRNHFRGRADDKKRPSIPRGVLSDWQGEPCPGGRSGAEKGMVRPSPEGICPETTLPLEGVSERINFFLSQPQSSRRLHQGIKKRTRVRGRAPPVKRPFAPGSRTDTPPSLGSVRRGHN